MPSFLTYAFPAAGSSTNRTLPDRITEIANVRDFGAVGDGVTDDSPAISNALERYSVDLILAAGSLHVPASAVRATMTSSITGNAVTALTIGDIGDNYDASRVYPLVFSGGGGTGATGTATATAAGIINQASLAITSGGTGYTSAPTVKVEYPGHTRTLTFTTMPADLLTSRYNSYMYHRVAGKDTGRIMLLTVLTSINVGAKTALFTARTDTSVTVLFDNTAVVNNGDLAAGDTIRFCREPVGAVFFPAGTYRATVPVSLEGISRSFHIYGVGKASKIIGNFPDYVVKRQGPVPAASAHGGTRRIEKLYVENEHPTGGGIRMGESVGFAIHDCFIRANKGINSYNQDFQVNNAPWGSFEGAITNCDLSPGLNITGSQGIMVLNDGPTLNNVIEDYEVGWGHCGGQGGQIVAGNTFLRCGTGVYQGRMPDNTQHNANFHGVIGNTFKDCGTAIRFAKHNLYGNSVEATNGIHGIYAQNDIVNDSVYAGNIIKGSYSVASFYYHPNSASNRNRTLIVANRADTNTNGAATDGTWKMPTAANNARFVENSHGIVYTFANLPPNTDAGASGWNRHESESFNISNCNTDVFGAVAAAGAPNHHVKVRAGPAPSRSYTVVGK